MIITINEVLFVLFQMIIGHFLADYGFALTPKMLAAKSKGEPTGPIAQHSLIHGILIFIILIINFPELPLWLILFCSFLEFITHLIIDTLKGLIQNANKKLNDIKNPLYWHLFQIDQFLHVSNKFLIIFLISIYICNYNRI